MASIFSKIISGEIPSYKIYEDEKVISFLALDQVTRGHSLLVPKKEVDYWIDMPESEYIYLQKIALKMGRALQDATSCRKVFQTVVGLEVPHFHLHLIPAQSIADLNFANAKRLPEMEMKAIQNKILQQL